MSREGGSTSRPVNCKQGGEHCDHRVENHLFSFSPQV